MSNKGYLVKTYAIQVKEGELVKEKAERIITPKELLDPGRARALELVNEWNRLAMIGGGDIIWHYVLEGVHHG